MKIGMIVAVEDEILTAFDKTEVIRKKDGAFDIASFRFNGSDVYMIKCGAGEVRAAAATQLLITGYKVDLIVNVGVVGALKKELKTLSCVLVNEVVHYEYDTAAIDHVPVGKYECFDSVVLKTDETYLKKAIKALGNISLARCASGDKFVDGEEKKSALSRDFGCDICDMECAGILITCKYMNVPCVIIKAVSDSAMGGAEEFDALKKAAAENCVDLIKKII